MARNPLAYDDGTNPALVNPLSTQEFPAPAGVVVPQSNPYADTLNRIAQYIHNQRLDASAQGLWDDQTGLPTQAGILNAIKQYGGALMAGTSAPETLVNRLAAANQVSRSFPENVEGGQQVVFLAPDGRFIHSNNPSHQALLDAAGITTGLDPFLKQTGTIRAHGADNYEVHQMPTASQLRAIGESVRADGGTSFHVDVPNEAGDYTGETFSSSGRGMSEMRDWIANNLASAKTKQP